MKDDSLAVVLRAIRQAADDRGYLSVTLDELVAATGLSRSTIRRALGDLAAERTIESRASRGPGGGYLIRLRGLNTIEHNSEHNSDFAMPLENFGSGGLRPLEPEPNSLATAELNTIEHNWPTGRWTPPELPADVRKRGAQFFSEVRLGLLPNKAKAPNDKGVNRLEPLAKTSGRIGSARWEQLALFDDEAPE